MLACSAGGRADGAAQEVHAGGDGASAHGEEPVQGALHGTAGGGAVDRDDTSFQK